jgi:hypothetical protein
MIAASTDYALCKRVEGRTFRIVRRGSKREMTSARRAGNAESRGRPFRVFLSPGRGVGELIR